MSISNDKSTVSLTSNFNLTNYGMFNLGGCKVTQIGPKELLSYLRYPPQKLVAGTANKLTTLKTGESFVFLNSSVIKYNNFWMIQSAEKTFPIVDNPYLMGQIACARMLNAIYGLQITKCDSITAEIGVSRQMSETEKKKVNSLLHRGFLEVAASNEVKIAGVDYMDNPLCYIGGTATAIVPLLDLKVPKDIQLGDVVILTKPLGSQLAVYSYKWAKDPNNMSVLEAVSSITEQHLQDAYDYAVENMLQLNKTALNFLKKYNVRTAATVGQQGLLGTCQEIIANQTNNLDIVIHNIPIIEKMAVMDKHFQNEFRLLEGLSQETSGGLLVGMPQDFAKSFIEEYSKIDGCKAWVVGVVKKGFKQAMLFEKTYTLEVSPSSQYSPIEP